MKSRCQIWKYAVLWKEIYILWSDIDSNPDFTRTWLWLVTLHIYTSVSFPIKWGQHWSPCLLNGWSVRWEIICSVQFSSVAQSCPTLCDSMNHSTPGLPVHHQLPEFTQTHVHRVSDAIQTSHPLSSPSPPAPNPSQHQSLFQWVNSSHEVAKVLEFQL